jgi:hypothetical protein
MDRQERERLIERYAAGYDAVAGAMKEIGPEKLDARPADGWSPRMIAHHLADSEMTSALRLRRLIAEERPAIVGYDEELWSRTVHYDRPVETALEAFRAARANTVTILREMSDAEWEREGTHNELGRYTPEVWLEIYARHAFDHAGQIRRAAGG